MLINSDFEINIRSIEEFARVMVPEALDKTMNLTMKETSDTIEIDMEIDGRKGNFIYANQEDKIDEQKQTMVKILLLKVYNKEYSWGGLMGVRPTKVLRRLLSLGYSYEQAEDMLRDFYIVSNEKIELLIDTVKKELEFLNREYINLYIGVPFCPTKCKYCSFASYEINGGVGRYYKGFVETLLEEIEMAGKFLKDEGYKIESIYIGGGTPSTLTEEDLEKVLRKVNENIDMTYLKEFTFEAGREDSLTEKKLELVKQYGADRISLNPQTFNEETLRKVNRNFNRENFDKYFKIAKEMGFIINMDLIIGLPDETTEDVLHTLNEVEKYDIENLTVHSLAFKRASKLFKEDKSRKELDREIIEKRIRELTEKKQMKPYYMYRQKNIMEWGENVGYAKEGKESVFNIEMIEENQSTMGLGGGAITKIVIEETEFRDYIERIINPKDPALYIKEMKERMESKYKLFKKGEK
ncbi:coproporphyrinogen III oxidase [Fusobacterium ulcerans]|uniref:Oxygen-independent coproporphyrinogen-III oxidase 2 n=1 Tax=Fusobacterium ulcerans TaxID=861 RepID=A0AAX2J905_9FUSO|nr:coproporphyrinogen III oxidase [Fusobacterium ulcerans]AVQ28201.1 coproporphyrinogen III oxidase [Fusobacterium ulcerans]EFS25666.1 coproporphyrinogen dehydrogenase HemZ [Fusobacterium ulcerans ATCC 49185]SQI99980.1 Oxygen-independent coproporphyrinogen-III oxidase 2 [Fusobacterium ulcerans]